MFAAYPGTLSAMEIGCHLFTAIPSKKNDCISDFHHIVSLDSRAQHFQGVNITISKYKTLHFPFRPLLSQETSEQHLDEVMTISVT